MRYQSTHSTMPLGASFAKIVSSSRKFLLSSLLPSQTYFFHTFLSLPANPALPSPPSCLPSLVASPDSRLIFIASIIFSANCNFTRFIYVLRRRQEFASAGHIVTESRIKMSKLECSLVGLRSRVSAGL